MAIIIAIIMLLWYYLLHVNIIIPTVWDATAWVMRAPGVHAGSAYLPVPFEHLQATFFTDPHDLITSNIFFGPEGHTGRDWYIRLIQLLLSVIFSDFTQCYYCDFTNLEKYLTYFCLFNSKLLLTVILRYLPSLEEYFYRHVRTEWLILKCTYPNWVMNAYTWHTTCCLKCCFSLIYIYSRHLQPLEGFIPC